ncbi:alpha/beta fold hydrolase [Microbacterium sp. AGC62]
MPHITVANGTELFYDTFGHPSAHPLLLIEGLTAQMIKWREEFCQLLVNAGFYVVRFDNRDVGLSQKFPSVTYSLDDMAEDTAGLLEALNLTHVHVVGQSMGGMISQLLAIARPELVASLSLIYTTASSRWLLPQAVDREILEDHEDLGREQAIQLFLDGELACSSDEDIYPRDHAWLRELAEASFDRDALKSGNARQASAVFRAGDRTESVRRITAPTLVLTGDADALIDPRASHELHALISTSRLEVVAGMGHELPQKAWPVIVETIAANAARALCDSPSRQHPSTTTSNNPRDHNSVLAPTTTE